LDNERSKSSKSSGDLQTSNSNQTKLTNQIKELEKNIADSKAQWDKLEDQRYTLKKNLQDLENALTSGSTDEGKELDKKMLIQKN